MSIPDISIELLGSTLQNRLLESLLNEPLDDIPEAKHWPCFMGPFGPYPVSARVHRANLQVVNGNPVVEVIALVTSLDFSGHDPVGAGTALANSENFGDLKEGEILVLQSNLTITHHDDIVYARLTDPKFVNDAHQHFLTYITSLFPIQYELFNLKPLLSSLSSKLDHIRVGMRSFYQNLEVFNNLICEFWLDSNTTPSGPVKAVIEYDALQAAPDAAARLSSGAVERLVRSEWPSKYGYVKSADFKGGPKNELVVTFRINEGHGVHVDGVVLVTAVQQSTGRFLVQAKVESVDISEPIYTFGGVDWYYDEEDYINDIFDIGILDLNIDGSPGSLGGGTLTSVSSTSKGIDFEAVFDSIEQDSILYGKPPYQITLYEDCAGKPTSNKFTLRQPASVAGIDKIRDVTICLVYLAGDGKVNFNLTGPSSTVLKPGGPEANFELSYTGDPGEEAESELIIINDLEPMRTIVRYMPAPEALDASDDHLTLTQSTKVTKGCGGTTSKTVIKGNRNWSIRSSDGRPFVVCSVLLEQSGRFLTVTGPKPGSFRQWGYAGFRFDVRKWPETEQTAKFKVKVSGGNELAADIKLVPQPKLVIKPTIIASPVRKGAFSFRKQQKSKTDKPTSPFGGFLIQLCMALDPEKLIHIADILSYFPPCPIPHLEVEKSIIAVQLGYATPPWRINIHTLDNSNAEHIIGLRGKSRPSSDIFLEHTDSFERATAFGNGGHSPIQIHALPMYLHRGEKFRIGEQIDKISWMPEGLLVFGKNGPSYLDRDTGEVREFEQGVIGVERIGSKFFALTPRSVHRLLSRGSLGERVGLISDHRKNLQFQKIITRDDKVALIHNGGISIGVYDHKMRIIKLHPMIETPAPVKNAVWLNDDILISTETSMSLFSYDGKSGRILMRGRSDLRKPLERILSIGESVVALDSEGAFLHFNAADLTEETVSRGSEMLTTEWITFGESHLAKISRSGDSIEVWEVAPVCPRPPIDAQERNYFVMTD